MIINLFMIDKKISVLGVGVNLGFKKVIYFFKCWES